MLATHRLWSTAKSVYLRITLNWVTITFFVFSFIHCFAQSTLQSFLFSADDAWGSFTSEIVDRAQINSTAFVLYTGRHGQYSLGLCSQVPVTGGDPNPCDHFYTVGQTEPVSIPRRFLRTDAPISVPSGSSSNATSVSAAVSGTSSSRLINVDSQPRSDGFADVLISSDDGSVSITLNPVCTFTLLYPQAQLSQARREDLSLIGTQFWFYGLAVFAIVFESVPHILALLIARMIATGWSTYALWRTTNIRDRMFHLIATADTPCHIDLYSQYFVRRFALQLADLVLHLDALLISTFLSWRLYKVYRTHTFSRVGPPKHVLRMYAYFLAVLVSIQLSIFILVNAMALWVDQLLHGAIKDLSSHTPVYNGTFILTTVLLIPWLMMGWYSVRLERRKLTWVFLGVAFFFVFAWSMMFYSQVYRFTFVDWPFFGAMTVTSFVALFCSTGFAVMCARNYDKGLAQWLYVERKFGNDDFEPDLFSTEMTENEWKPDGDRASIYKVALPDLLRFDPAPVA